MFIGSRGRESYLISLSCDDRRRTRHRTPIVERNGSALARAGERHDSLAANREGRRVGGPRTMSRCAKDFCASGDVQRRPFTLDWDRLTYVTHVRPPRPPLKTSGCRPPAISPDRSALSRSLLVQGERESGRIPILVECAMHDFLLAFRRQPADRWVAVEVGRERVSLCAGCDCRGDFRVAYPPRGATLAQYRIQRFAHSRAVEYFHRPAISR